MYKYNLKHTVTFRPQYTHDDLINMNYYALLRKIKINKDVFNICNNDDFWYAKVCNDYGLNICNNKPPNETYREQYEYLVNTTVLERYVYPRADGLLLNQQMGYKQYSKPIQNINNEPDEVILHSNTIPVSMYQQIWTYLLSWW